MGVAQEEIFGPVASVIPFSTEEEAIRLANAVEYGLSGSIWTSNLGRAIRVAKGIQTGVLSVNSSHSVHTEAPSGAKAWRHRPRDGHARREPLHRSEERVLLAGIGPPRTEWLGSEIVRDDKGFVVTGHDLVGTAPAQRWPLARAPFAPPLAAAGSILPGASGPRPSLRDQPLSRAWSGGEHVLGRHVVGKGQGVDAA